MMDKAPVCPLCGLKPWERCILPDCRRPAILTSVTDAGEVMVTMPSGRIVFMRFWQACKFITAALFKGWKVKVEE